MRIEDRRDGSSLDALRSPLSAFAEQNFGHSPTVYTKPTAYFTLRHIGVLARKPPDFDLCCSVNALRSNRCSASVILTLSLFSELRQFLYAVLDSKFVQARTNFRNSKTHSAPPL